MSNLIKEFFKPETVHHKELDNLDEILEIISPEHLNILKKSYSISDEDDNSAIEILNRSIVQELKTRLDSFSKEELKTFYDFYNGISDYSNAYIYVHLKKFLSLGYIFLFTQNNGKYFNFVMPNQVLKEFERCLRI